MKLVDALESRWRNDDKPLAWHVTAPVDMLALLYRAKVPLDDVMKRASARSTNGPKSTKAEIKAYLATVTGEVPKQVLDTWATVGPAEWSVDGVDYRVLGPTEILAQRDALRAKTRNSLRKLRPTIDVLATIDGEPAVLMDPGNVRDKTFWFHYGDGETYSVVSYMIAVRMILPLYRAIRARVLDIYRLDVGKKPGPSARRARLVKGKRCWEGVVDGKMTALRTGAIGGHEAAAVETHASPAAATAVFDAALAKAKKSGYA